MKQNFVDDLVDSALDPQDARTSVVTNVATASRPTEDPLGLVANGLKAVREHDRVRHPAAACSSVAVIVCPCNLQVIGPPCLRLIGDRERDVDRCQVAEC